MGDQNTVQLAQQPAHNKGSDNRNNVRHGASDTHSRQRTDGFIQQIHGGSADGTQHGANGQVNAAGDDDKAHSQGNHAGIGVIAQNIQPGHEDLRHGNADGMGDHNPNHALQDNHDNQGKDRGGNAAPGSAGL